MLGPLDFVLRLSSAAVLAARRCAAIRLPALSRPDPGKGTLGETGRCAAAELGRPHDYQRCLAGATSGSGRQRGALPGEVGVLAGPRRPMAAIFRNIGSSIPPSPGAPALGPVATARAHLAHVTPKAQQPGPWPRQFACPAGLEWPEHEQPRVQRLPAPKAAGGPPGRGPGRKEAAGQRKIAGEGSRQSTVAAVRPPLLLPRPSRTFGPRCAPAPRDGPFHQGAVFLRNAAPSLEQFTGQILQTTGAVLHCSESVVVWKGMPVAVACRRRERSIPVKVLPVAALARKEPKSSTSANFATSAGALTNYREP